MIATTLFALVASSLVSAHGLCSRGQAGQFGCEASANQLWECDGTNWVTVGGACGAGTTCSVSASYVGCALSLSQTATAASPAAPAAPTSSVAPAAPVSGSGVGLVCPTASAFACINNQFLQCRSSSAGAQQVWALDDDCQANGATCTTSGAPGQPGFKGCIPDPANDCPQTAFGQWRCVGQQLQQCAFDPTFEIIETCGAGYVCQATPNFTGCILATQSRLNLGSAVAVEASTGAITPAVSAGVAVASVGLIAAVGAALYIRNKKIRAAKTQGPASESFIAA